MRFYKKLTLANLLNWFAMRSFRIGRAFCGQLVLRAIALDPSRSIFKDNLAALGMGGSDNKLYQAKSTKQTFLTYSIPEGCKSLSQKIKFFEINQTLELS